MNKGAYAIFIIFWLSINATAQDYAITTQYDTIRGDINILLPGEFYDEIQINTGDDKSRYKSYNVLTFVSEGQTYETVQFNKKYHFMRVVTPGFLTYYEYRADQGYQFTTGFLYKKSDEGLELPNLSFKKIMTSFLSDCGEVAEKIDSKELGRRDVEQIVHEYNSCKDYGQKEISEARSKKQSTDTAIESDHPAVAKINALLTQIDDAELKTLLNDIKSKLNAGEDIPSYMLAALKGSGNDEVVDLASMLK